MKVELLIQKALMPGIPSAKAYQLVFTDSHIYFLFLSRDWGGFGAPGANVIGRIAVSVAGAISQNKIDEKLKEIENQNLDELISSDKQNVKAAYSEILEFTHKKKGFISGHAFVNFKTPFGSFKFCFLEENSRITIAEFVKNKRPDLVI